MSLPYWLLIGAAACLSVMLLTAGIAFLVLKRGSQAIGQRLQDVAEAAANSVNNTDSADGSSRWSRTDATQIDQPAITIEMADCPACGGQNPSGSAACSFCGRKL